MPGHFSPKQRRQSPWGSGGLWPPTPPELPARMETQPSTRPLSQVSEAPSRAVGPGLSSPKAPSCAAGPRLGSGHLGGLSPLRINEDRGPLPGLLGGPYRVMQVRSTCSGRERSTHDGSLWVTLTGESQSHPEMPPTAHTGLLPLGSQRSSFLKGKGDGGWGVDMAPSSPSAGRGFLHHGWARLSHGSSGTVTATGPWLSLSGRPTPTAAAPVPQRED